MAHIQAACAILRLTMWLRGENGITTVELPAELQFRVVCRPEWAERIVEVGSLGLVVWTGWKWPNLWFRIGAAFGILALLANWLQGRETQLSVTAWEVAARGNIGRLFRTDLVVPVADINSVEYFVGDEGKPPGLYVMQRWARTCLLPGLNEAEANGIVDAILRKFPEIGGDQNPNSLLFGERTEPLTLGLNAKNHR
jgi:hypothetical protein